MGANKSKDKTVGHDSEEVTKEDYKRFRKIFPNEYLDSNETHNAYMKIKNQKYDFTDDEIRESSLYPHRRKKDNKKEGYKKGGKVKKGGSCGGYKKGGKVRGCGIAKKGVRAAKMR